MKLILVTVVMPTLKVNKYFWEAVESIQTQTFENWEFIIVMSKECFEGEREELSALCKKDSRIRVIFENANVSGAANIAIRAAKSDLIARMDSDDVSDKRRLELQYEYMKNHPQVGVLGGNCDFVDSGGKVLRTSDMEVENCELEKNIYFRTPFLHPTVMMRKGIVESVGGYDESLGAAEDYDLWSRLVGKTKFHNLEEVLLKYRKHGENTTIKRFPQKMDAEDKIVERLEKQLNIPLHIKIRRRIGLFVERYFGNKMRKLTWR